MPKHAVTAAGEAMPAETTLGRLSRLLKAGDVQEALSMLSTLEDATEEHPWKKARRLGKELSRALAETGDNEFAYILPDGRYDFPVFFGDLQAVSVKAELPVDTVDRVSKRLAFALDDWHEHTGTKWVAHVNAASSGRGVWFENVSINTKSRDESCLAQLSDRCERALAAWDATHDAPDASVSDNPINIEIDASRQALLDFHPTSLQGMHMKAAAMLKFRPTSEWDDLDRLELIRAFAKGGAQQ